MKGNSWGVGITQRLKYMGGRGQFEGERKGRCEVKDKVGDDGVVVHLWVRFEEG